MTLAQECGQGGTPRRPREVCRIDASLLQLVQRHAQPAGARLGRQLLEHLDFAQRRAQRTPAMCRWRQGRERVSCRGLDHGRSPPFAVRRQPATRLKCDCGQVPHGGVYESGQPCKR